MSSDDARIEEIRRVLAEARNAIDPFAYAFELSDIEILLATIDDLKKRDREHIAAIERMNRESISIAMYESVSAELQATKAALKASEERRERAVEMIDDMHSKLRLSEERRKMAIAALRSTRECVFMLVAGPLDLAAKYGPDFDGPTDDQIGTILNNADFALGEGKEGA